MTEAEARCPDCNTPLAPGAELCPECGTILAESNAPADTMDLGIELVQGSGYSENEFMPSPEAAAEAQPPAPTSVEPAIPAEPPAPSPPAPPPATSIEPAIPEIAESPESPEPRESGFNFESMTDPSALAEAAAAAALEAEVLELESMIPTAEPAADVTPPAEDIHTAATVRTPAQPAPEEELLDLDMDLEMVDTPAPPAAPPPTRAEPAIEAPAPPPPPRAPRPDTRPTPISIPTEPIPDEVLPAGGPRRKTAEPEGEDDKRLFKNRTPDKKKVGAIGILLRLVLALSLGAAGWFVAGAPGADALRDMGIPVPGGTERLRYITNRLAEPIQIRADNDPYAVADPGVRLAVPAGAGTPLTWHLVQPPQAGSLMGGENFSAELVEFTVEGEDEYYEVTYQSVDYWMFTPLVTNPTNTPMTAIVNAGTPRAIPCDCIIPARAESHHIGYYPFEAGVDIRFYDAENFDANRYREVRNVTTEVAEGTGAVEVRIPRR